MLLRHLELEPFSRGRKSRSGYGLLARSVRYYPTLMSLGFGLEFAMVIFAEIFSRNDWTKSSLVVDLFFCCDG